jgi:hypothetical protein
LDGGVDYEAITTNSIKKAASGFEPENGGFADLCLPTWLSRRLLNDKVKE